MKSFAKAKNSTCRFTAKVATPPFIDGSGAWVEDGRDPDLRYAPPEVHRIGMGSCLGGSHWSKGMPGLADPPKFAFPKAHMTVAERMRSCLRISQAWKAYKANRKLPTPSEKSTKSPLRRQDRPQTERPLRVDEIEMRVQIQLDGPRSADRRSLRWHQGIIAPKSDQTAAQRIRVIPDPAKADGAADEVKYVMGGRKCEVEHFAGERIPPHPTTSKWLRSSTT